MYWNDIIDHQSITDMGTLNILHSICIAQFAPQPNYEQQFSAQIHDMPCLLSNYIMHTR